MMFYNVIPTVAPYGVVEEIENKEDQLAKNKQSNVLPIWGNEKSMNLNHLILTNIQSSHYFKVVLYELKTYHEVIDEIFYNVKHIEPWEKGSRNTSGQTGMCGGVRGVGAGGIVSTAFCILYKLFTLKLTRKQVNGLINHCDSPFIRSLGFMYTQPPSDLWDWFEPYLDDEEELDVKAGGGHVMTIGALLQHFLTKLEWYGTLFPRIPVPLQKEIERQLARKFPPARHRAAPQTTASRSQLRKEARHISDRDLSFGEAERISRMNRQERSRPRERHHSRSPRHHERTHSEEKCRDRYHKRGRERTGEKSDRDYNEYHPRSRSKEYYSHKQYANSRNS